MFLTTFQAFSPVQAPWETARQNCLDGMGGRLAEIRSMNQQTCVLNALNGFPRDVWMGLNDMAVERETPTLRFLIA